MNKLELTVLSGISGGDIFRFDLDSDKSKIGIGRSPDNDLVLQDPTVSRHHAEISRKGTDFILADLGSSHGTVHMGFNVKPGEGGSRKLADGDEFKVGEAIFRANFEAIEAPVEQAEEDSSTDDRASVLQKRNSLKNKKVIGVAVLAVVLLVVLLWPGKKPPARQLSKVAMTLPQERVVGYLNTGRKKRQRDYSHKAQAMFSLPAADLVIEFEYKSASAVDVFIDESLIGQLDSSPEGWKYFDIVARDPLVGKERKLIFKNRSYAAAKKGGVPIKKWAVRNIRATPITRNDEKNLNDQLEKAIASAVALDKTPERLFSLIRQLHVALLEATAEVSRDAEVLEAPIESSFPGSIEVQQELKGILAERLSPETEFTNEVLARHLRVLSSLTGRLEAELWRRVNNRYSSAKVAAKSKNGMAAYDHLQATMAMFPDETDFRWVLAKRMLHNKRIVPSKIRKNPNKFRKKGR